jgi:hypothetical protein
MLKRLSTPATAAAAPEPQAAAVGKKQRKKKLSKQKQSPKDEQFPSPAHESVSEFEFSDLSGSHPEVYVDWSTHQITPPSPPFPSHEQDISTEREEILQEIGRQFSAITKEPSRRRGIGGGPGVGGRGPNVKRLSATGLQGSANRRKRAQLGPPAESMESIDDLVPPLRLSVVKQHSGNRVTQELGNTDDIELRDDFDVLVPRGKSRSSVLDQDSFRRLDTVEPMEASQPMNSTFREEQQPQSTNPEEGSTEHNILHTSLLLETMEEGEVETRIDGDESGTVLIQTHMSEKETAIVGEDGHAALLPASELGQEPQNELSAGAPGSSGVPPPPPPPPIEGPEGQATPTSEATPPPPPEPVKQERKPWPCKYIKLAQNDIQFITFFL